MDIDQNKCYCDSAGHCPLRNYNMTQRMWQCCQGISGLSKEKEQAYLDMLPKKDINNIKEPSFLEKIANFGKAVTKFIQSGFQKTPEQLAAERLEICEGCPMLEKVGNWKCKMCGCNLKVKATWQSAQCPLDKWPKV